MEEKKEKMEKIKKEAVSLSLLVKSHSEFGEIEKASEYHQLLLKNENCFDSFYRKESSVFISVFSLLKFYVLHNDSAKIEEIKFFCIEKKMIEISIANQILFFYQKNNLLKEFEEFFVSLSVLGVSPDDTTFAHLFFLLKPDDYEGVISATQALFENGVSLGIYKSHPLFVALSSHVQNQKTFDLMKETVNSLAHLNHFHAKDLLLLFETVRNSIYKKEQSVDLDQESIDLDESLLDIDLDSTPNIEIEITSASENEN